VSTEFTVSSPQRVRYWTPEEANEALPDLVAQVTRAQALLQHGRGLMTSPGRGGDLARGEVERVQSQLREILDGFAEQGVDVKGLEPALLDFPALRYGLEVYLCWKEGEDIVTWWHPIPTGIAGRQPVDETGDGAWEWCN